MEVAVLRRVVSQEVICREQGDDDSAGDGVHVLGMAPGSARGDPVIPCMARVTWGPAFSSHPGRR